MRLTSHSFEHGGRIPAEFAFVVHNAVTHVALSSDRNPHLASHDVPEGTQSFVLVCRDPDVPSRGDDVNREGREVPASLDRIDFFHWLLFDIPANITEIVAGSHSTMVIHEESQAPDAADGWRHGINDYTGWFANEEEMKAHTTVTMALAPVE